MYPLCARSAERRTAKPKCLDFPIFENNVKLLLHSKTLKIIKNEKINLLGRNPNKRL